MPFLYSDLLYLPNLRECAGANLLRSSIAREYSRAVKTGEW